MASVKLRIPAGKFAAKILSIISLPGVAVLVGMGGMPAGVSAGPQIIPDRLVQAKNYVLAACMIHAYKGEPIAEEAKAWAGGLMENGSLSAASYAALSGLAKSVPPPGMAQQGMTMKLQNCVEFAQSKQAIAKCGRLSETDNVTMAACWRGAARYSTGQGRHLPDRAAFRSRQTGCRCHLACQSNLPYPSWMTLALAGFSSLISLFLRHRY